MVSNLVMSSSQMNYDSPSFPDDSSENFTTRTSVLNKVSQASDNMHPDIVLLLQESTTDPRLYQLPDPALLPHFSMFEQGTAVKAHTLMRVQTFGGDLVIGVFSPHGVAQR